MAAYNPDLTEDGLRRRVRLQQMALDAWMRFQMLWSRGAAKVELETARQEAVRLTRESQA